MFLTLAITILIVCIYHICTRNLNHWKKKGVKYIKPLPLVGNLLPIVTKSLSIADLIKKLYNEFPEERYVGIFQFTTPVLLVRDPELIKKITIKNFENFVDHTGFISEEVDPLWGKNLFSSKGDRWRDLRQTLSPVFTSSKMRAMYILMDECARQLVDYFKGQSKNLIEVELKDVFARYTNDVIASTAFGIKCDSLKQRNNEFLLAGRELIDVSGLKRFKFMLYGNFPVLTKLLNLKIVNTKVSNFFRSLINETLAIREEKNIVRPDLIHMLMMARQGKLKYEDYTDIPEAGFAAVQESATGIGGKNITFLTNEDITAQAVVFFLGGFDTSSSLMCFAGYELAVNPHIQTRLKEEIIQTFHKSDGKISYEHLLSMKYLDMVLSEALRKWTQAIWIDRKCTKDFEIESEKEGEPTLKIKVGDVCWLPIFGIHWDPKYYPNPEIFDPERFSEENKEKIKSTTYLPFGIGPRNCIGSRFALLETKILFYYLLLDFDFVPVEKTQIPIKLKKDSAFLLAEKGFYVGLKRNQRIL